MSNGLGQINIVIPNDCSTLESKTVEHFEALHLWLNGEGPEAKIIKKGLSIHAIMRNHVIKVTFRLYTE